MTAVGVQPAAADTTPTKLIFIGDSITAGDCVGTIGAGGSVTLPPYYTFRDPLLRDLEDAGYLIDAVGWSTSTTDGTSSSPPVTTMPGTCFAHSDDEHGSRPSRRADALVTDIQQNIASIATPDVAVVMAGINDLRTGDSVTVVADDLEDIIDELKAANAGIEIFLSTVLDTTDTAGGANADVGPLNVEINSRFGSTPGVTIVDLNSVFVLGTHNSDKLHANKLGAQVLADELRSALVAGDVLNDGDDSGATGGGSDIAQIEMLLAASPATNDRLGFSVAVDGNTAVAGAYQSGTDNPGQAYVYEKTGSVWAETAKLTPSDGVNRDQFGWSVDIEGDNIIVGANNYSGVGSAYVFTRNLGVWSEQQKLTATDGAGFDKFGFDVAIDGDTAIVGAYNDDTVDFNAGAAYVFERSGTVWTETAQLTLPPVATAPDPNNNAGFAAGSDYFGWSVDLDGDTAVIGAPNDDVKIGGVNESNQGTVSIFTRSVGVWSQQQTVVRSNRTSSDLLGLSVEIDGDTLIAGAPYADPSGMLINSGVAAVFDRSGVTWTQETTLTGDNSGGNASDLFGYSVALDGDNAVVGAYKEEAGGVTNGGVGYHFSRDGGAWTKRSYMSDAPVANDYLARSVAIIGDDIVSGAYAFTGSSHGAVFFHDAGPDGAAPTWPSGSLSQTSITANSVGLSWSGFPLDAAGYKIFQDGVEVRDVLGTTVTIAPLDPSDSYNFVVQAYDASGNLSNDGPSLAVNTPSGDSADPTWAAGALGTSNLTDVSIDIDWSGTAAADNVAVTGYQVFLDGTLLVDLPAGSSAFSITGLLQSTLYSVSVEAYDAEGNTSSTGPTASFTTTTGPDLTAPTWTGGTLTASAPASDPDTEVDLVWTADATDDVLVTDFTLLVSTDAGVTFNALLPDTSGTGLAFTATGLMPETDYQFKVEAKDAAGNTSSNGPTSSTITTAATADVTAPTWTGGTLTASAPASDADTEVDLVWTDDATDNVLVTDFTLLVSTDAGVTFDPLVPDTSGTGLAFTATGLTPATDYQFKVEAKDAAGNTSSDGPISLSITTAADATAPAWTGGTLTASAPASDPETSVDLLWTDDASDNVLVTDFTLLISTDAGVSFSPLLPDTSGTGLAFTATGLTPDTAYQFKVEAKDAAGNTSSDGPTSLSITTAADATAPTWTGGTLTASAPAVTPETAVDLVWTDDASDNILVTDYTLLVSTDAGVSFSTLVSDTSGLGLTFTASGLTPDTDYVFKVEAKDAAGNTSSDGPTSLSITTASAPDVTPPSWSGGTLTASAPLTNADSSVDLVWTDDATDDVLVTDFTLMVSVDAGVSYSAVVPDTSGLGLTFTVGGLTPSTDYVFKVEAKDAVGNTSSDGPISLSITTAADATAPTWTGGTLTASAPAITPETAVDLVWTADADDNVLVTDYTLLVSTDAGVSFSALVPDTTGLGLTFNASGLTPDTDYVFKVEAKDAEGNTSSDGPTSLSITTASAPDVTAPTWTGGTLTASAPASDADTEVDLLWTADADDAVGVTDYTLLVSTDAGVSFSALVPDTSGLGLTFTASGLTPDTAYQFKVEAKDAAGNTSSDGPTSLSITTAADATAPVWAGGTLTASAPVSDADTEVDLVWTADATDNVLVTDFTLLVSTDAGVSFTALVPDTTGTTLTFTASGLTPETDYQFKVEAKDAAGNTSSDGPISGTITTAASVDITIPDWPTGSLTASSPVTNADTVVDLVWSGANDNVAVTDYQLFVTPTGGSETEVLPGPFGPDEFFTVTGLTPETEYTFRVEALDAAANVSTDGPSSAAITTAAAQGNLTDVTEIEKLLAADNEKNDRLGYSVAVDGNYAVAGAYRQGTSPAGPGSAYVFEKVGGDWTEVKKLVAFDGLDGDRFGVSVDIDGDTIIVGTEVTGVGAAYIFVRSGADWLLEQRLSEDDGNGAADDFGFSVAVDGDYAVVGARKDDVPRNNGGGAYVFERSGTVWTNVTKLTLPDLNDPGYDPANTLGYIDGNDNFGWSVDISGDTIIVGSPQDDVAIGGTNYINVGSASIFVRGGGGTWAHQESITRSNPAAGDLFGQAVSIKGDRALVGAPSADPAAESNAGEAFVFDRSGTTWSETTVLVGEAGSTSPNFGISVDVDGSNVVVGAYRADGPSLTNSGLAYYFSEDGGAWNRIKIEAGDPANSDFFGLGVTIDADNILVGAYGEDGTAGTALGGSGVGAVYAFELGSSSDTTSPVWAGGTLTASNPTPTSLDLVWTADATDNAAVTGYTLLVSTNGGASFVPLVPDTSGLGLSFTATGLTPDTDYVFKVEAKDAAGNVSSNGPVSATASTLPSPDAIAPNWVGGTITGDNITETTIDLTWTNDAQDNIAVTDFTLLISADAGVSFTQLSPDTSGLGLTFTATGLIAATDYLFKVEAKDAVGNTSTDGPTSATITTAAPDTTAPTWSGGTLTGSNPTDTTIDLVWTDDAGDAVGVTDFTLLVSTDAGLTFNPLLPDTSGLGLTFTATGLTSNTDYQFKVEAKDLAGNTSTDGPTSATVTTTGPDIVAPIWNGGGTLTASNETETTVDLVWTDTSSDSVGVTDFTLLVSTDAGVTFNPLLPDTSGLGLTFTATGLTGGTDYQFKVEAKDLAGNTSTDGPTSATITTTAPDITAPAWNGGGTLTASNETETTVDLVWTDTSTDDTAVTDFTLLFSTDAGVTFDPLVPDTSGLTLTFTATGLTPATDYQFKVEAKDAVGNTSTDGPTSATITTLTPPDTTAPVWNGGGTLTASNETETTVDLVWTDTSTDDTAVTDFTLLFSTDAGVTFDPLVPDTSGLTLTFTATGLTSGTDYLFKVEAKDLVGNTSIDGPTSATITTVTPPDTTAPIWTSGQLNATNPTGDTIDLDWSGDSDDVAVTGYMLYVTETGESEVPVIPGPVGVVSSFTVSNLDPLTEYTFRIEAVDAAANVSTTGPVSTAISTTADNNPIPPITELIRLEASDAANSDNFGYDVAIDGNTAVVGARYEDENGSNSGSAYVFTKTLGVWSQSAKLTASNGGNNDYFGYSVAISGDTIVVGAWSEDGPTDSGAAYVFTGSGSTWTEQAMLEGSNESSADYFGQDVAIDGDTLVVGAHKEDSAATNAGAGYVYTRTGSTWTEQAILTLPGTGDAGYDPGNTAGYAWKSGIETGWSVDVDGDTVVMGAPLADNKFNDVLISDHGIASVWTRTGSTWSHQATLLPSDVESGGRFGYDVAIEGDRVVVGHPFFEGTGDPTRSGGIFVFDRTGSTWAETSILTSDTKFEDGQLGFAVAIDGVNVAGGVRYDGVALANEQEAAHMFTDNGGSWSQLQLITTDGGNGISDRFSFAVSISGATVFSGAWQHTGAQGRAYVHEAVVDTSNPTWPGGAVLSTTPDVTTVDLSWPAALDNVGIDEYIVYVDAAEVGRTSSTTFQATGLTSLQSYDFAVRPVDGAGNVGAPVTATDTTLFGDSTLPTWPSGTSTVTGTTGSAATVSFSGATDDVGVTAYRVYRDAVFVEEITSSPVTVTGLAANTSYDITIQAIDAAGNESTDGPTATAMTGGLVPINEIIKILNPGGANSDRMGYAIDIDGDYAVAGAYQEDDAGVNAGAAHVFQNINGTWTEVAVLTASDAANYDFFGWSVAMSGDTIVVGAYGEDGPTLSGAAYVFTGSGSTWTEQAKLKAGNAGGSDRFGQSVSIDGDSILVGAYLEDTASTNAGAGYVFTRSGSTWTEQAMLVLPEGNLLGQAQTGDNMGWSAAIDGDTAILGAPNDDSLINDVPRTDHGTANVFVRSGSTWSHQATLTPANLKSFDEVGWSVAVDGDRALVGSPFYDHNGNFRDGGVFEFERTGTTWTESNLLTAADGADEAWFGYSVDLDGDEAVIGAYKAAFNGITEPGAAYYFSKATGIWSQKKLVASDAGNSDRFAFDVGISNGAVVVGAFAKSAAVGAAYFFDPSLVIPVLAIDDVVIGEGSGGGTVTATLTVTLDTSQASTVEVDYTTVDGTATAGADYVATSGTLQFIGGSTSETIDVTINSDDVPEGNEALTVLLSNATSGIGIAQPTGDIDITDDDGAIPNLTVSDINLDEGDSGITIATVTFDLDRVPPVPVSFDYATADGSADSGDYTSESGTLTFNGVQQITEDFEISGDTISELDETFLVNLTNPTEGMTLGNTSATVTIDNDDGVLPVLDITSATRTEGQTGEVTVDLTISLLQAVGSSVTVDFATTSGGTATAGEDYVARSGQITLLAGETEAVESFTIFGDIDVEATETFTVQLSNPTPAITTFANSAGTVTISNDDFNEVIIDTAAGSGLSGPDCSGDGGQALLATFNRPYGITSDDQGNLFINDNTLGGTSSVIRRVDAATGIITTVAGTCGSVGFAGDGGQATSALIQESYGTEVDNLGNLYIADTKNHRVRKVDLTTGIITTFAGSGSRGYNSADDGGPATAAKMNTPMALEWYNGELYIADYLNHRIRKVDAAGNIHTVAGFNTGTASGDDAKGFVDNVDANSAKLHQPKGMAFDSQGNLYFADRDNQRVRRIDAVTNIITTVAGDGIKGYGGDDGPASASRLQSPRDVVIDALDNVYIADTTNRRVRVIEAGTGIIRTYAGTGQTGGTGDGGPALLGKLGSPYDMSLGPNGEIYIADDITATRRIRVLFPSTTAGTPPTWTADPLVPSNVTATGADVSWTAAADPDGIAGYDIFVDGDQVGTATGTSFSITGLTSATNYTITVEAEDTDGNRSTTGPSVPITTL